METGGGEDRETGSVMGNKNRRPVSVTLLIRSLYDVTVYLTSQRRCKVG